VVLIFDTTFKNQLFKTLKLFSCANYDTKYTGSVVDL